MGLVTEARKKTLSVEMLRSRRAGHGVECERAGRIGDAQDRAGNASAATSDSTAAIASPTSGRASGHAADDDGVAGSGDHGPGR